MSMDNHEQLDFSTILATSIHDMKNSLFMLMQSLEGLDLADNLTAHQHQSVADLHYQTSRINGTLMQLLALYRDEKKQLPVFIEENSVNDLMQDIVERHRLYFQSRHIDVSLMVDKDLYAYFDLDLIKYLISDIFINALRHTKNSVVVSVVQTPPYLVFKVEDDGNGYPQHMLDVNHGASNSFNANKGRSGLGLLFAKKIAEQHITTQHKGYISLENKPNNRGSIFTLHIP